MLDFLNGILNNILNHLNARIKNLKKLLPFSSGYKLLPTGFKKACSQNFVDAFQMQ